MTIKFALLMGMWCAAATQAASFVNISEANGNAALAPDAIAAAVGSGLSSQEMKADPLGPLPTSLGGIGVQVLDSAGMARLAGLYSVSDKQITYVMPTGTAPGTATVNILNNGTPTGMSAPAEVDPVAPALLSANGDGKGVAAALAVAIAIPSTMEFPVPVFQCGDEAGSCVAVPVNPGLDRPVILSFFGSGIRGAKTASVTIGGVDVPVQYAGPQPTYSGLDQINVPLILSLRGAGLVDVVVTADGVASNPVQISVQ